MYMFYFGGVVLNSSNSRTGGVCIFSKFLPPSSEILRCHNAGPLWQVISHTFIFFFFIYTMAQPAKKPKRQTKYCAHYQKEYPFIKKCSNSTNDNLNKFLCTSCNMNVLCTHRRINDMKDHISTNNHKSAHGNCQSKFIFTYYASSLLMLE